MDGYNCITALLVTILQRCDMKEAARVDGIDNLDRAAQLWVSDSASITRCAAASSRAFST